MIFIIHTILVFIVGIFWTLIYSLFDFVTSTFREFIRPKIHSAIYSKDITRIEKYLEKGCDINSLDIEKKTVLHLAVNFKNYDLAKLLLERGANVNLKDRYDITPLHIAAIAKEKSLINLLMSYGATNSIFISTLQRNHEALHNYLQIGGDPNIKVGKQRQSLLEFAIESHSLEMVELLIKKGAKVNYRNGCGLTPLYIAACEGQLAISEALVTQKANINAICQQQTILYRAICSGNKYLVEFLLQNGANINLKFNRGNCYVLHQAVAQGNLEIVELLIDRGANIDSRNELPFRETPLHLAIKQGDLKIVKLLLSRGANVHLKTFFPLTDSLQMATDYPEIYNLIKSYQIKTDWAIFNAASQGNFNFVKDYLEKGGNVNASDRLTMTLLHYASSKGHNNLVQLLIDNGANINAQTQQEITPLFLAVKYSLFSENKSIAALLIVNGAIVDSRSAALLKNLEILEDKSTENSPSNAKNKNA